MLFKMLPVIVTRAPFTRVDSRSGLMNVGDEVAQPQ